MANTTATTAATEKRHASVVIVGGGVIGCATAYYLAKRGMKDVLVLESNEIGHGGSSRNGGGVRQSARDVRELPLAMYAVANMWPTLSEELGGDTEYTQKGNLRLGKTEAHLKTLAGQVEKSTKVGLDVRMISGDEARELCPQMSHTVIGASWCPTDGHANPLTTTLAFYRRALQLGVTFVTGVEATGLRKVHGRARVVETTDGDYEGDQIVLAAGWWSRGIANTVGIDIPMERQFSEVLVTEMEPNMFPMMLGTAEADFYGHQTHHGSFVMGGSSGIEPFASNKDRFANNPLTAPCISRGIIKYFPILENAKIVRTWAGIMDMCKDGVPVIDNVKEVPGLTLACAFTGHGFGISPAVGLTVSELVLDGAARTIDISQLKYDRFTAKA